MPPRTRCYRNHCKKRKVTIAYANLGTDNVRSYTNYPVQLCKYHFEQFKEGPLRAWSGLVMYPPSSNDENKKNRGPETMWNSRQTSMRSYCLRRRCKMTRLLPMNKYHFIVDYYGRIWSNRSLPIGRIYRGDPNNHETKNSLPALRVTDALFPKIRVRRPKKSPSMPQLRRSIPCAKTDRYRRSLDFYILRG